MKYKLNNLYINGGKKTIFEKKPHWKWPPKSIGKKKEILNYYSNEQKDRIGYPKVVEKFEKNFAKYLNMKYALCTNSATSALFAAFSALELKKNDEIIVPSLTFHATASPLSQLSATPVLCDCEIDTGNISPQDIENKITKKTKAIVITHLCGHPCEMEKIMKIKKKYKLHLIEDCSHAHGSTYKKRKVGTYGEISCFSLGSQKLLPAGEGGILVTNKKILFEKCLLSSDFNQRLPNQISDKKLRKFNITGYGIKHRIHPISAVIANYELKKINIYIKKRNQVLNKFSKDIKCIPGIQPPVTRNGMHRGAFFCYRPFINLKELNNISLKLFIDILQKEGMEVRRSSHPPLHNLHLFKKINLKKNLKRKFPNSEKFYNNTITIPTFTLENKKLINQYISAFKKVCYILNKNKFQIKKK